MTAECPNCQSHEVEAKDGYNTTLVGFLGGAPGHDHNNNCWKKFYRCRECDTKWEHALRRRCPAEDCDFETKETCFCFSQIPDGKALFEWPTPKYLLIYDKATREWSSSTTP